MKNKRLSQVWSASSIIVQSKGLEMQFAWLFAMIVGAVILVFAVVSVLKITETQNTAIDAATAKEIGVLLNPLEIGFESAKTTTLVLPKETRIYNNCTTNPGFGKQTIRLSQKNFNQWSETDVDVGFENKYIFSESAIEGRKFLIFSKPFEFPYKVSDLIFLTSSDKKYCFLNPPDDISAELTNLGQDNIVIDSCPADSVKVCFSGSSEICDISVSSNSVRKNSEEMFFENNALMYAAIFSSPELYECQFKRLMKRDSQLALLYSDKAEIVSANGCSTNLGGDLSVLSGTLDSVDESTDINSFVVEEINEINDRNEVSNCRLW